MDPRDASASKNNIYLDYPKITDCIFQQSYLASAAVSVFVVILVELTNTETVVGSPLKAMLNFQKATNQREVLSGPFFW